MITLTERAIQKIQTLQTEDELEGLMQGKGVSLGAPLRVAVRPGGCSGFSYDMYFDFKEPQEDDWVGFFGNLRVVIDPESVVYLKGSILDYKEGLTGAGFSFNNPNVNRSCGCGQSFS
jgi:iron-sulfur cluster assembly protein/iron-sulfur cluster insertion protein